MVGSPDAAGSDSLRSDDLPRPRSLLSRLRRGLGLALLALVLIAMCTWCAVAIYFSNLPGQTLRTGAATCFVVGWVVAFAFVPNRRRVTLGFLGAFVVVHTGWQLIPASHDRDWLTEMAVLPEAEIAGDQVTIRNIRDFRYRSEDDFDVRYYEKTFDLRDLETLDFVKSDWGLVDVVHTMLSFGFSTGEYLAVSVEPRREKGEPQTGLRSLFKQYEIIYILGDERDLFHVRTNIRGEDVYVYPTRTTSEQARIILVDILETVDGIARKPRFYNLLTHNCITSLEPHVRKALPGGGFDWRIILNGHSPRMVYDQGWLDTTLPFEELRALHHINAYAPLDPDTGTVGYSQRIRLHRTSGG